MKITHVEDEPIHIFPCVSVAPGGKRVESREIPVFREELYQQIARENERAVQTVPDLLDRLE